MTQSQCLEERNVADVATPPTTHYYLYAFGSAVRRYLDVLSFIDVIVSGPRKAYSQNTSIGPQRPKFLLDFSKH